MGPDAPRGIPHQRVHDAPDLHSKVVCEVQKVVWSISIKTLPLPEKAKADLAKNWVWRLQPRLAQCLEPAPRRGFQPVCVVRFAGLGH